MPEVAINNEVRRKIRNNHGNNVLKRLESEIDKINDMLKWKSSLEECFPRFRVVKQHGNEYFVEIGFTAMERDYRAIAGWLDNKDQFIILTVVKKEQHYQTSKQSKIFNLIDKHGERIMEAERN